MDYYSYSFEDSYYSYQWWRNERVTTKEDELTVPYAVGHGGQYLFLIEDYDMIRVATSTCNNPARRIIDILSMIEDFILFGAPTNTNLYARFWTYFLNDFIKRLPVI